MTHHRYCHKPIDVLRAAIEQGIARTMLFDSNRFGRPGAIVEDLSDQNRELLRQLRSMDVERQRWEFGHCKMHKRQKAEDLR